MKVIISTHTLTWSVTRMEYGKERYIRFQLTRSRGAWRTYIPDVMLPLNFNSHAHVERDGVEKPLGVWDFISTHTLTWSVTFTAHYFLAIMTISTHTLTWSVTLFSFFSHPPIVISTHTLTWSVTSHNIKQITKMKISTHTLTWSVT